MYELAVLLLDRSEITDGRRWLLGRARAGHAPAMQAAGWLADELGDTTEAELWYRRAADSSEP